MFRTDAPRSTPNPSFKGEAQQPATLRCLWYSQLRVAVCRPRLNSNVRRHTKRLFPSVGFCTILLAGRLR